MVIVDECSCDQWAQHLVVDLFKQNKIFCDKVHIADMDDNWIMLVAVFQGRADNKKLSLKRKKYVVKYVVEKETLLTVVVSVALFERKTVERAGPTGNVYKDSAIRIIDKGIYLINSSFGSVKRQKTKTSSDSGNPSITD